MDFSSAKKQHFFDKIKGPEWARSRNGNVEKVN